MNFRNLALSALAIALGAALLLGGGCRRGSDAKKQGDARQGGDETAARFFVPEGKDAGFYEELAARLSQEFNEAVKDAKTPEGSQRLRKDVGDAFRNVYLYTKDKADVKSKGTSDIAFSQAILNYAGSESLSELKALREEANDDVLRCSADLEIVPLEIREAAARGDGNAIPALLDALFPALKSEPPRADVAGIAERVAGDLEKYDGEIASAFSERFVEAFKDAEAYRATVEGFVGRERFKRMIGSEVRVEGLFSDGSEVDWNAYRGKVVLVDIWRAQSSQRVFDFDKYREYYEKYRDDGFEILGYALHTDVDALRAEEAELKLPWRSISETLSLQAKQKGGKEFVSLPNYYGLRRETTILVDRAGKAVATGVPPKELWTYVEDLVYEPIDESIFNVPDGKVVAFYAELETKLSAAVQRKIAKTNSPEEEALVVRQWRDALAAIFKHAQNAPDGEELCGSALASLSRIALAYRDVESVKELLGALSNEKYREQIENIVAEVQARVDGRARFENLVGNEMKVEGLYLDGTEIDWSAYRGKVVLFDFWATWCGSCLEEFPRVQALYEKYHDAGFEVVGYSVDKDVDALKKFEEESKLPWKIASQTLSIDAKEQGGKEFVSLSDYYGIVLVPTMILVGRDGKVLDTNARGERLEELLREQFPDVQ